MGLFQLRIRYFSGYRVSTANFVLPIFNFFSIFIWNAVWNIPREFIDLPFLSYGDIGYKSSEGDTEVVAR